MPEVTAPAPRYGQPSRGLTEGDVERAADALLRTASVPPSPESARDSAPALRIPGGRDSAAPVSMQARPPSTDSRNPTRTSPRPSGCQALDEGRQRAQIELKTKERSTADQQQTLRGPLSRSFLTRCELDSRLRGRETTITDLQLQLRELTLMLREEQATRGAQAPENPDRSRISALRQEKLKPASDDCDRDACLRDFKKGAITYVKGRQPLAPSPLVVNARCEATKIANFPKNEHWR